MSEGLDGFDWHRNRASDCVTGPGFDSQQVHDYDLCDIYKPYIVPVPYSRNIAICRAVTLQT
jgi:hypothetical protein